MSNPFDFNEDEASRAFEKSIIFGTPAGTESAESSEFLKKSMARSTFMTEDLEDSQSVLFRTKTSSFNAVYPGSDGLQSKNQTTAAKPPIKYNSADLIKSARSNHVRASSDYNNRQSYEGLDDVVRNKPQVSASEFQRVQDDLIKAKQMIEMMRGQKWANLPIKDTIRNMVTGKSYSLDGYKSYKDKQSLLVEAVQSKDGDVVLAIVLFLERTLKEALFHREIRKQRVACDQYIYYLRKVEEWKKLEDFFIYLLRYEDAALLRYERIYLNKNSKEKIEELYNWIKDFGLKTEVAELTSYVKDEIGLIEKQRQLEAEDQAKATNNSDIVMKYHQRPPVILTSLVTTVSYCALFHYEKGDKYYPDSLKKAFRLTDKQYEWCVLPPLANRHRWPDIQELFTSTNWLMKKMKQNETSYMGFEYVVTVLHKAKSNEEVMAKYLSLISNSDVRLKFAARYQMHDVAIQTLVDLRDRQRLEDYRLRIGGTSSSHTRKIIDLLNNTQIKWR